MDLKIQDVAKALGSVACSLAEVTGSDMGIVILIKGNNVGLFLGGEDNQDADKIVVNLRRLQKHITQLSESIAKGETKCDGICYGMDDSGHVTPLGKKQNPNRKTDDPDISLLT